MARIWGDFTVIAQVTIMYDMFKNDIHIAIKVEADIYFII